MKVILLAATTLNGRIARHQEEKVDWTSREDKRLFAQISKKGGVVIVGHHTFKTLKKPLSERLMIVLTRKPKKEKSIPNRVEFTDQSPKKIINNLTRRGFKMAIVGGGSQINALFLKAGLIDEIWLTLAPRIFGKGISLFGEEKFDFQALLISVSKLDKNFLLIKYKVDY